MMHLRQTGFALLASVALLAAPAMALADSYKIDDSTKGSHASINFSTKHLGYSILTGRFDKFTGIIDFNEKEPQKSSVTVEIDVTSINSNHPARDEHLRGPDFFDAAKFPTASFKSTAIKITNKTSAKITGDLTLHGVTKPVILQAEHIGGGKDPWGGFRQGFSATTSIVPAEFGMKHMIAKQTINLQLNVEAIKQ